MSDLTPSTEAIRFAQVFEVTQLIFNGMTQKDACETVGISPDTFRRWMSKDTSALTALSDIKQTTEREQLYLITTAMTKLLASMLDQLLSGAPLEFKDKLAAYKLLSDRADQLAESQGATSASEEKAREYLTGPALKKADSKMGSRTVNVRPRKDGSVDVTLFDEREIVEGEITDSHEWPPQLSGGLDAVFEDMQE